MRLIQAIILLAIVQLVSCKNEPKSTTQPTDGQTKELSAAELEAETKQAVAIDSMTKNLKSMEMNIKQATEDLDKAINELPE